MFFSPSFMRCILSVGLEPNSGVEVLMTTWSQPHSPACILAASSCWFILKGCNEFNRHVSPSCHVVSRVLERLLHVPVFFFFLLFFMWRCVQRHVIHVSGHACYICPYVGVTGFECRGGGQLPVMADPRLAPVAAVR